MTANVLTSASRTSSLLRLHSLAPVADSHAHTLLLGTMPGPASLAARQYYAHPRNAFWPIVGALFGFAPDAAYPLRLQALRGAGIALWDVLAECRRAGAADSAIRDACANDFTTFLRAHARIRRIGFNGGAAETLFRRHVAAADLPDGIEYLRLPSTSPAHAAMPFDAKLAAWRILQLPR